MEEFLNIVMTYLPIPTAIATVVVSLVSVFKKVKDITGNTFSSNEKLKEAISVTEKKLAEVVETSSKEISELKDAIVEQQKEILKVIEENKQVKELCEKVITLVDETSEIKNQLTTLLSEKE